MVLSKPIYHALGFYFEQLFYNPLRTKALTCCVIATAGSYASQRLAGVKAVNHQSLLAYALYGLLFGGTLPHYFYTWLENVVPDEAAFPIVKKLILERLLYSPLYLAFTLYVLARFEGKDHKDAVKQLESLYWTVLTSSWKYLTIAQLLNFKLVPPMMRVLVLNLIGFIWTIYIANKRRQQQARSKAQK